MALTGLVGSKIRKNMWRDAVTCFSTGKVKHSVASQLQDVSNIYGIRDENSDTRRKNERK